MSIGRLPPGPPVNAFDVYDARHRFEGRWLTVFFITAVAFGFTRALVWPGHPLSFWGTVETAAHVWVGFLFGAVVFYRGTYLSGKPDYSFRLFAFWILLGPSVVELVMAVLYLQGVYVR